MPRTNLIFGVVASILILCVQVWADGFTLRDARELAIRAANLIEKEGINRARMIFHDPHSVFVKGEKGELYVFVLNFHGDLLFHPRPDLEGRNAYDWKDSDGNFMVREMISIARAIGRGWVEYSAWDPKSNEVRRKVSFVARVGGSEIFAGAGIVMEKGKSLI